MVFPCSRETWTKARHRRRREAAYNGRGKGRPEQFGGTLSSQRVALPKKLRIVSNLRAAPRGRRPVEGTTHSARAAAMAEAVPDSPNPPAPDPHPAPLPAVCLELAHGSARTTRYDIAEAGFLVGTVPGCDVRVPGTNLPPVLCLITRHPHGVLLRKLAPLFAVQVNGQAVASARLADGDRITVGPVEVRVQITPAADMATPSPREGAPAGDEPRQLQLQEQARELEADRLLWYRRREEIEREYQQREQELAALRQQLEQAGGELAARATTPDDWKELLQQRQDLDRRAAQLAGQHEQLEGVRRELDGLRQQLYERYRARRDRLAGQAAAVRRAARKLQARKKELDEQQRDLLGQSEEVEARRQELATRTEDLAQQATLVEEQQRLFEERQQELQTELAGRLRECQHHERRLAEDKQELEKKQAQYQDDVLRLDRLQAVLDQRQKQLQDRAQEVDRAYEQLQRGTRDLEEQAGELDAWQARLTATEERLTAQKTEQETATAQIAQRLATLEGQQAMLATLRTRLERKREDLLRDEKQLAEQRARQEADEADLKERLQEAQRLRRELENEKLLHEQERQRFEERRALLESAVAQLRQAQDAMAAEQEQLQARSGALDATAAAQAEEAGLLQGRAEQLNGLQARLEADRQQLTRRETELAQAEQGLQKLQEQLRRRSEDLQTRQRSLADQTQRQEAESAALEARRAEAEREQQQAEEQISAQRQALATRTAELANWGRELDGREETLRRLVAEVKEARTRLNADRQALGEDHARWAADHQAAAEAMARSRDECESLRATALDLQGQLPDLELRAQAALDRLAQSRELLREHLGEVHSYAQQSRDDLAALRDQVRADAERVRREEAALHQARDEHRLAVAAFRQQLLDWQGQVAEIKRALAQGETRLERRQAEVDATSARLAQEAEELQQQQRQVAERRDEVHRHLEDMREWYRRKLRELAASQGGEAVPAADGAEDGTAGITPLSEPAILALTGHVEPGDRQLGDLLRSLELVDADTLTALLSEARRQRRSLRQLLLSGGYLTLYQMALIEAGNVDALVLGPVRVVDRLRATAQEVVYRVFDPRRGHEAVLRHLSESESEDAVRPDEYRQRFAAAAAVQHPHVAATLEVLDVAGRPAVLQEWLTGMASCDWPTLAAVPGVWFRLVCQAALGLHTAHQAGLAHGHLGAESLVLTGEGILKICGFGEPEWLWAGPRPDGAEADAAGDVTALGRVAAAWVAPGANQRKPVRAKPLPESLQRILHRLTAEDASERYANAAALLEDLDRAGGDVPANGAAWDRFLRHIRDQAAPAGQRLSA
jgi:hypothetical protein